MTIANYHGSLLEQSATVSASTQSKQWEEMVRFNYFRTFVLEDGSSYRGLAPIFRRRVGGLFQYRLSNPQEADAAADFEQAW